MLEGGQGKIKVMNYKKYEYDDINRKQLYILNDKNRIKNIYLIIIIMLKWRSSFFN